MTCHILQSGLSSDQIPGVFHQRTSLQHDSIVAVADGRSVCLQTVSQMLHPAGIMHGVPDHFQNNTLWQYARPCIA